MEKGLNPPIKIRHITIRNYKGIDALTLDFPPPRMPDDPDILVMGSENGLGKTSVIECCSLLLLALPLEGKRFKSLFELYGRHLELDVPDLLIKAGSDCAEITGDIVLGDESGRVQIQIARNGAVSISCESLRKKIHEDERFDLARETDHFIEAICGFTLDPVVENTFLLFHSYRKVQEGNPELGMMVEGDRSPRWQRRGHKFPMSIFKLRILRSLMSRADLFEFVEKEEPDETLEKLNDLMKFYAGGEIHKLRPSSDNTVEVRVKPRTGKDSFAFDGLSSGQKEIISTLFLIWDHTKNNPSVVFIDEPELHLNAQWHRSFVKKLVSLAPQNQYIMATHSEDIMDSVNEDRRVLLLSNQGDDR